MWITAAGAVPGSIASEETDRLIASDEVEGTARLAAIGIPSDARAIR